ncbi:MAG: class I SAM-dependent methyltransferase [Steroidobacteraceae bacterium]
MNLRVAALVAAASLVLTSCATQRGADTVALDRLLTASHRTAESRARDSQRHPSATLSFFGIRDDMTVVEVWPGGGWYTELLAPLLRERGHLYAAHLDPASSEYARKTVDAFRAKLAARPDVYDKVVVTTLAAPPAVNAIAPPASADMVVTFRNLHNWMMFGWQREAVEAMHAALKPGGILGVVEHRADPERQPDPKAASGYVPESYAIELIESVGFKLVAASQVNANPEDTKDYEKGVWTLPPTFAAGAQNRDRYAAIGESDRFTLKFVKVK